MFTLIHEWFIPRYFQLWRFGAKIWFLRTLRNPNFFLSGRLYSSFFFFLQAGRYWQVLFFLFFFFFIRHRMPDPDNITYWNAARPIERILTNIDCEFMRCVETFLPFFFLILFFIRKNISTLFFKNTFWE